MLTIRVFIQKLGIREGKYFRHLIRPFSVDWCLVLEITPV
jgi:hypothetical protein